MGGGGGGGRQTGLEHLIARCDVEHAVLPQAMHDVLR